MDNRQFIEQCIHDHSIHKIIERAKEEVELYPVIVPSYKNRYHFMYDYFEENSIPFMVFVYEDDFTASGYDKYQFKHGEIVRITPEDFAYYGIEGKLLGKKRFYIEQYAKIHGISKYFMIDDDYIPESCARYIENGELIQMEYSDLLKSIQFIFDAYDLVICSASDRYKMKKFKYDAPYYEKNINGTFLVNNDLMIANSIYWETEPMFEDDDICIKVKLAGLPYGRISCFGVDNNGDVKKSVIPSKDELAFNLYKKYPWCTDVRIHYNKNFDKYTLIKVFNNARITKDRTNINREKHHAAMTMTIPEFKEWLLHGDKSETIESFF